MAILTFISLILSLGEIDDHKLYGAVITVIEIMVWLQFYKASIKLFHDIDEIKIANLILRKQNNYIVIYTVGLLFMIISFFTKAQDITIATIIFVCLRIYLLCNVNNIKKLLQAVSK